MLAFADTAGITFPMLSDVGSATIRAYGLENEDLGIPHPGTLVIDANGVIQAKVFLNGYRKRHDSAQLIDIAKILGRTDPQAPQA